MTFLATDPRFLRHDRSDHPESAQRLRAILEHADRDPALARLPRLAPDRPATEEELLRVHTRRALLAVEHAELVAPAFLDPDTYVVPGSFEAARLAARLTIQSAARSLERDEGGLALVRPPGHHATGDRSMGFCLFNNVAVAAQAMLDEGRARRVLVFDHDVHHGNGTQDIFYGSDRVLYQSFHLSPHYPGTGAIDETGTGDGVGFTMNAPLTRGAGVDDVRAVLEHVFLPTARAFRPDLILVSAGFDSLEGDPLGGLRLPPEFFGEMIARVRAITRRVVTVLEGGYQIDKIPLAVAQQARALEGVAFATPATDATPVARALQSALAPHWPVLGT